MPTYPDRSVNGGFSGFISKALGRIVPDFAKAAKFCPRPASFCRSIQDWDRWTFY
ncbi:hypothetical protein [Parasphingorhabdus halotolerans]|uniref:Uncharacterized protein n=1 Tax=Parasphingorhabdus halotolerans TaxID=2725558 RepID=A0A6H2DK21_9SPHN|nr:hypothetical protein [Parasphingorhabdus halotolerans]QJB68006.1 hypothetical protein HF685_00700 [Parasphingorhabdus halotolerans]